LSNSGFVWVRPPSALAKDFELYGKRVEVALYAAANAWGQQIQDAARQNKPWEDRTANAKTGLFYAVDGLGMGEIVGEISAGALALKNEVEEVRANGNEIIIVLAHTVFYGKHLELSHGEKYAVIMSTIEANLPALETLLRKAYGSA
jgi:hypothetical protein